MFNGRVFIKIEGFITLFEPCAFPGLIEAYAGRRDFVLHAFGEG